MMNQKLSSFEDILISLRGSRLHKEEILSGRSPSPLHKFILMGWIDLIQGKPAGHQVCLRKRGVGQKVSMNPVDTIEQLFAELDGCSWSRP
jgi:hypothetical protein